MIHTWAILHKSTSQDLTAVASQRLAEVAEEFFTQAYGWKFRVCLVVGQLERDRPLTSSLVPPILRDNRGQHWIVLSQPLTQNQTTLLEGSSRRLSQATITFTSSYDPFNTF